jgi:hypothetical protein
MTWPRCGLNINLGHYTYRRLEPSGENQLGASETFSEQMHNVGDVTARTASATPRAFYDELRADITQRPADVVAHLAEGALVGGAATLLLKMPRVAAIAGGALMIAGAYEGLSKTSTFLSQAAGAQNEASKATLAKDTSQALGANLSAMVESAPGMIAGGAFTAMKVGAPPLYGRAASALDSKLISPIKSAAVEALNFRGPGSMPLSRAISGEGGYIDAVELGKVFAARHPWQGVETGSTLDLAKMRISRPVTGMADEITALPGTTRDNTVPFHIHGPQSPIGYRPSNADIAATRDLGILQQGNKTTFYMGEAREHAALARAGNADYFSPTMRAVTVDHQTRLAERHVAQWMPGKGFMSTPSIALDYDKTLAALRAIKPAAAWKTLESIAAKSS